MVKKMVNIQDIKDLAKTKIMHPKLSFDDSWEKAAGVSTKSLMTLPLVHDNHMMGVLQLVNKKNRGVFSSRDERMGFLVAQALALALFNQKKNAPVIANQEVEVDESLQQESKPSEIVAQNSSANILVQREDDETTILVRVLKDGSRLVYQQIDPPKDVIKLIKEVANIDLNLPPNPHRRKDDSID